LGGHLLKSKSRPSLATFSNTTWDACLVKARSLSERQSWHYQPINLIGY